MYTILLYYNEILSIEIKQQYVGIYYSINTSTIVNWKNFIDFKRTCNCKCDLD